MKKHSKQNPETTKQNKINNMQKPGNKDYQRVRARARMISYLIHDTLHLTFAQCVQLIITGYKYGHLIANANIRKRNLANLDNKDIAPISEFDESTFNHVLTKGIDFATSAHKFTA